MEWSPHITRQDPPENDQQVFYFFEPSGRWFCGKWNGWDETFHGRFGFCDKYDAPYWHPEPPNPTTGIGSQEILPDCMMPDGAEPCKGYLQMQETAIHLTHERRILSGQVLALSRALATLVANHGYVDYCSEEERLSDPDFEQALDALHEAGKNYAR